MPWRGAEGEKGRDIKKEKGEAVNKPSGEPSGKEGKRHGKAG